MRLGEQGPECGKVPMSLLTVASSQRLTGPLRTAPVVSPETEGDLDRRVLEDDVDDIRPLFGGYGDDGD